MTIFLINIREEMLGCDCVIDYLDSVHLTLESAKIRSRQVPNSIITEEYVHGEI